MQTMAHAYEARTEGEKLIIEDVPIFVECSRGENQFDSAWIAEAVRKARQAEEEGYLPPLHIRHHGDQDDVMRAGFFRIKGTQTIRFKGQARVGILADLIITDPQAAQDVIQHRLPYRSVEIHDVSDPGIGSLALLDHEAPYLELPMLFVSGVDDAAMPAGERPEHFSEQGVLFGIRRGKRAAVTLTNQLEVNTMARAKNQTPPKGNAGAVNFEKDEGPEKDSSEEMQEGEGGMDVGAICKAIKSGSISIADMGAIMDAIQEQQGSSAEGETMEDKDEPAPAAAPGAEAMSARLAKLQGELEATRARLDQREQLDQRKADVAVAMKRLEGRPLGSGLEDKLVAFHKEHGPRAFTAYVDSMAESFARISGDDTDAANFQAQAPKPASKAASRFAALGPDATNKAIRFSAEWKQLSETGHTRLSEDRYLALNMAREGFNLED